MLSSERLAPLNDTIDPNFRLSATEKRSQAVDTQRINSKLGGEVLVPWHINASGLKRPTFLYHHVLYQIIQFSCPDKVWP